MRIIGSILLAVLSLAFVSSCGDDEDAAVLSVSNYPNPCSYATGTKLVVKYDSPALVTGDLEFYIYIYDLNGFPVVVQHKTEAFTPGTPIEVPWAITNDRGNKLAPGVYLFKVVTVGVDNTLSAHSASSKIMVQ